MDDTIFYHSRSFDGNLDGNMDWFCNTFFTITGALVGTWIGVLVYYKEFESSTRKWPIDFESQEPYNVRSFLYPLTGALIVGAAAKTLAS
jgi:hypothetical protein